MNVSKKLISSGNDFRKQHGPSVLADLAIGKIALDRERHRSKDNGNTGTAEYRPRRTCHIIDSIKNQEELDVLRLVYRDMLYFIGVFAPVHIRQRNLENKGMTLSEVYGLIDRDSGEEINHGQTVRATFPQADFFLRVGSESDKQLKAKIERFLDLILQTEVVTPSSGETAMYQAASAAGNSACLSRQVGAALTDKHGKLISVGWNDVPKFGGDLYRYSPDDDRLGELDKRCMNLEGGTCFNDLEKNLITEQIVSDLIKQQVLSEDNRQKAQEVVRRSKINNLVEFSRSIHAEMHAIIMGSQLAGDRVKGGKLYSTTYPCHSCARHIIAAGIEEVYYIEPYRKSLATKLHDDAITEAEDAKGKVRILPFDGVAPSRYLELFRMASDARKVPGTGKKVKVNPKAAVPKCDVTIESIPALEDLVVKSLADRKLIKVGDDK